MENMKNHRYKFISCGCMRKEEIMQLPVTMCHNLSTVGT